LKNKQIENKKKHTKIQINENKTKTKNKTIFLKKFLRNSQALLLFCSKFYYSKLASMLHCDFAYSQSGQNI